MYGSIEGSQLLSVLHELDSEWYLVVLEGLQLLFCSSLPGDVGSSSFFLVCFPGKRKGDLIWY